jgi:hypothetical protein
MINYPSLFLAERGNFKNPYPEKFFWKQIGYPGNINHDINVLYLGITSSSHSDKRAGGYTTLLYKKIK